MIVEFIESLLFLSTLSCYFDTKCRYVELEINGTLINGTFEEAIDKPCVIQSCTKDLSESKKVEYTLSPKNCESMVSTDINLECCIFLSRTENKDQIIIDSYRYKSQISRTDIYGKDEKYDSDANSKTINLTKVLIIIVFSIYAFILIFIWHSKKKHNHQTIKSSQIYTYIQSNSTSTPKTSKIVEPSIIPGEFTKIADDLSKLLPSYDTIVLSIPIYEERLMQGTPESDTSQGYKGQDTI